MSNSLISCIKEDSTFLLNDSDAEKQNLGEQDLGNERSLRKEFDSSLLRQDLNRNSASDRENLLSERNSVAALTPDMIRLQAGTFRMGGNQYSWEQPIHEVSIPKPFAIGRFAVTFEEFDRFAVANGLQLPDDLGWGRGHHPAVNVSWYDAMGYVQWLSKITGNSYRLPSEAEWEYAARAGTQTEYWWGEQFDSNKAHCEACSNKRTSIWRKLLGSRRSSSNKPEGTLEADSPDIQANPWGLSQTAGNVWEWCQDIWHDNYQGAPANGGAWSGEAKSAKQNRVIRGGSWDADRGNVRSAYRYGDDPSVGYFDVGFRIAQDLAE